MNGNTIDKSIYSTGTGNSAQVVSADVLSQYLPVEIKVEPFNKKDNGELFYKTVIIAQKIEAEAFPVSRQNQNGNYVNGVRYFENQIKITLPDPYWDMAVGVSPAYTQQLDPMIKNQIAIDTGTRIKALYKAIADAKAQIAVLKQRVKQVAQKHNVVDLYKQLRVDAPQTGAIAQELMPEMQSVEQQYSIQSMITRGILPNNAVVEKSTNKQGYINYNLKF